MPYGAVSRLGDPLALDGGRINARMGLLQDLVERGQRGAVADWLEQMYRRTGEQVGIYLDELRALYPDRQRTVAYDFSGKGRAPLYGVVARSLYRRILAGEFAGRAYLPSVPQLMQTYEVSKSTACAAVALLSDLGFIRALDKKGTVLRRGGEPPPLRLERSVIDEQLILFLDALQILAIGAKRLTLAAFSALDAPGRAAVLAAWQREPQPLCLSRIVPLLLELLRRRTPHDCLKNVMEQFDELLIWGHYLRRLGYSREGLQGPEQEAARQFALLCAAWRREDAAACADAAQAILRTAYFVARKHVRSCTPTPDRLPAALD